MYICTERERERRVHVEVVAASIFPSYTSILGDI